MSVKTRIAAFAFAALASVGTTAFLGLGIAAGVVGPAAIGSGIAADPAGYYDYGYRRCGAGRPFDAYGNARVPSCSY